MFISRKTDTECISPGRKSIIRNLVLCCQQFPVFINPFQLIFIQQGRRQSVGKIRKTESKIILIIFQRRTGKRNTISQYICKYYRTRLTTYFIHTLRVNVNQSFGIAEPQYSFIVFIGSSVGKCWSGHSIVESESVILFAFFLYTQQTVITAYPQPTLIILYNRHQRIVGKSGKYGLIIEAVHCQRRRKQTPFLTNKIKVMFGIFINRSNFVFIHESFRKNIGTQVLGSRVINTHTGFSGNPPFTGRIKTDLIHVALQQLRIGTGKVLYLFCLPIIVEQSL